MASGSKLNEALQMILDSFNNADTNLEEIEAENAELRQRKMELLGKLNPHFTVYSSSLFLEDMLLGQQTAFRARSESMEQAFTRCELTSQEAVVRITSWKQKFREVDSFMTLPYNEVQQKVVEIEKTIADNRSNINELTKEHEKLSLNQKDETEDDLKFYQTLKCIDEEQRKLLEELKEIDGKYQPPMGDEEIKLIDTCVLKI